MKITLCGSIAFYNEMLAVKKQLEGEGHEIKLPPLEITGRDGKPLSVIDYYKIRREANEADTWVWEEKKKAIMAHFEKIKWSDIILVLNYDKKGIAGYIGGNTLMEIGVAFYLDKPIYLLNKVPEISYKEEILGMWPKILNGDLSKMPSSI
jgi:nucleoside 2-deoxyribosyltransferase